MCGEGGEDRERDAGYNHVTSLCVEEGDREGERRDVLARSKRHVWTEVEGRGGEGDRQRKSQLESSWMCLGLIVTVFIPTAFMSPTFTSCNLSNARVSCV